MLETLVIVALVVAVLAIALHFVPAKDIHSAPIAKAQADVDAVYDWILAHLNHHDAIAAPVAVPAPVAGPIIPALAQSVGIPLDPVAAVTRYIAGGLTTAVGMPNLYELRWLYAQPKAAQVAWGTAVAKAFDAQLAPAVPSGDLPANATFTANTETVGEIPVKMRTEAASYLFAVGGGYPNVGVCNWTLA